MSYLNLQKDIQGFQTNGRYFPQVIYNAYLDDNSESHITVPNNYQNWLARIQPDYFGIFFASINHTATLPVSLTFVEATTEAIDIFRPYELKVKAGDKISILNYSGYSANCSIALFPVNNGGTY